MQLALAGLPENPASPSGRSWLGETAGALVEAMGEQDELKVHVGHDGCVWSVAFSPNGDRIVSGGDDGTVRLWQLDGSPAGEPFKGHDGWVGSVAFSPNGDRIVSGGRDGTVRLWDGASGREPRSAPPRAVGLCRGVLAGWQRIVSGSADRTLRMTWVPRSKQELIETARAQLPRELTDEERRRFYLALE